MRLLFLVLIFFAVAVYGNEELSTGLIKKILKQSRISRKMYEELRKKFEKSEGLDFFLFRRQRSQTIFGNSGRKI